MARGIKPAVRKAVAKDQKRFQKQLEWGFPEELKGKRINPLTYNKRLVSSVFSHIFRQLKLSPEIRKAALRNRAYAVEISTLYTRMYPPGRRGPFGQRKADCIRALRHSIEQAEMLYDVKTAYELREYLAELNEEQGTYAAFTRELFPILGEVNSRGLSRILGKRNFEIYTELSNEILAQQPGIGLVE